MSALAPGKVIQMSNRMYNLQHFIFTPKYRKAFLADAQVAAECERLLRRICSLHQIEIVELAIMPDHVHVFCEIPRRLSVAYSVQQMKRHTSYFLRKRFRALRQEKAFWGVRYFHRSVGGDRAAVTRYIANQIGDIR